MTNKFLPVRIRFEVKYTQGALILNTTDYNVLHDVLDIPFDKEGFKVKYLAVGTEFGILLNPDGGEGRYVIKEIRTFIYDEHNYGHLNSGGEYEWGFHVIYFVDEVK